MKLKILVMPNNTYQGKYLLYYDCDNMYVKRALGNKTYLAIEDNYLASNLPFYRSSRDTIPKIYDNGLESIWYLRYY